MEYVGTFPGVLALTLMMGWAERAHIRKDNISSGLFTQQIFDAYDVPGPVLRLSVTLSSWCLQSKSFYE